MGRLLAAKGCAFGLVLLVVAGTSLAGTRGTIYTKKSEVEPVGMVLIEGWDSDDGGFCSDPIDVRGYSSIAVSMAGNVLWSSTECTVSVAARVSPDDNFVALSDLTWTYTG